MAKTKVPTEIQAMLRAMAAEMQSVHSGDRVYAKTGQSGLYVPISETAFADTLIDYAENYFERQAANDARLSMIENQGER